MPHDPKTAMKITEVEPIHIAVPYRYGGPTANAWRTMDTLLVKVATDEGITGWGEAFGLGACAITRIAVEKAVAPLAVGRDPCDIGALMGELARRLHNYGRNGPVSYALSGLDIALWDIAGKVAGEPLHRLLGGPPVARVPCYASLLRYGAADLVALACGEVLARGYRYLKLHEVTVAAVAAARDEIGPGTPLMVDANCAWTGEEAIAIARAFSPYDLAWLEEPVWPPDDYAALARVRGAGTPVAAGENAGTLGDIERLIEARVDYLQPSLTKIGGVTEMRRIIALTAARGVALAPHSPYFGPGLIATVHVCASLPAPPPVERFYCDLEASPFGDQVNASDGHLRVPAGAGLGLTVDETVIERYRVAR